MSRIGNKIITVPEGVTVEIADDNTVTVTGSKGTLVKQFSPAISYRCKNVCRGADPFRSGRTSGKRSIYRSSRDHPGTYSDGRAWAV